tara:strand:- start:1845 stop:2033 length:189 start_codon:yes stop_codon:yes gene_type:complete
MSTIGVGDLARPRWKLLESVGIVLSIRTLSSGKKVVRFYNSHGVTNEYLLEDLVPIEQNNKE